MLEKKLDMLASQTKELRSKITNDINIVPSLNKTIEVKIVDTMSVSKPDPNIGADIDFNSVVFKMQNGQISEPIRTQRGFFIVQMKNITPFDQNLYTAESGKIRDGLLSQKKQGVVQEWIADLKEKAVIVDNRDKFFR